MNKLHPDWREFIELLNSHQVRYLIVGGFAVAFHGYPRLTEDIDFFLDASHENARRVLRALEDFGFGSLDLSEADFSTADRVVQLGYAPYRIDLITSISGVTFDEAWERRLTADLEGIPTQFVDRESLVRNKLATGRDKDRVDAKELP
jgi:hypothetical protein